MPTEDPFYTSADGRRLRDGGFLGKSERRRRRKSEQGVYAKPLEPFLNQPTSPQLRGWHHIYVRWDKLGTATQRRDYGGGPIQNRCFRKFNRSRIVKDSAANPFRTNKSNRATNQRTVMFGREGITHLWPHGAAGGSKVFCGLEFYQRRQRTNRRSRWLRSFLFRWIFVVGHWRVFRISFDGFHFAILSRHGWPRRSARRMIH